MKTKVTQRGQVTIPKMLRMRFGIRPGTLLDFTEEKGRLVVVKAESANPVDEVYGQFGLGRHTNDILKQLRENP